MVNACRTYAFTMLLGLPLHLGCVSESEREAAADTSLKAPYLDTVAAMHGALHVFWTNETLNCDAIEIERSTPKEEYQVIAAVESDVEDLADDDATDPSILYSYRLRCRKGDLYSPYSNEDARSPKAEDS
jgi:hypothetical protein